MWKSLDASPSPIKRDQNGMICMYPLAPTTDTANLRNALSTCTKPSTSCASNPARRASYQTVCRNSVRSCSSVLYRRSWSFFSVSHRKYARRAAVSANSGTGGELLAMAALNALRTESASGSSSCPPALASTIYSEEMNTDKRSRHFLREISPTLMRPNALSALPTHHLQPLCWRRYRDGAGIPPNRLSNPGLRW